MEAGGVPSSGREIFVAVRGSRRDLIELAIAYGLILLVVWTPRPWQSLLWWDAAAAVAFILSISFDGRKAMGLRSVNLLRSLWVVGMALAAAAGGCPRSRQAPYAASARKPSFIHRKVLGLRAVGVCATVPVAVLLLEATVAVAPKRQIRHPCGRGPLRNRSPAQPHPHLGHILMGLCRLHDLSSLPQPLSTGRGACHFRHRYRHHGARTRGPQYAGWPGLPDLWARAKTGRSTGAIETRSRPSRRGRRVQRQERDERKQGRDQVCRSDHEAQVHCAPSPPPIPRAPRQTLVTRAGQISINFLPGLTDTSTRDSWRLM